MVLPGFPKPWDYSLIKVASMTLRCLCAKFSRLASHAVIHGPIQVLLTFNQPRALNLALIILHTQINSVIHAQSTRTKSMSVEDTIQVLLQLVKPAVFAKEER